MAAVTSLALSAAGLGLSVFGAVKQGEAQGKALEMQEKAVQAQIDQQNKLIANARSSAAISPSEIKSINSLLATRESQLTSTLQGIAKQQELLDKMDPQVKAAGENLLGLLKGEASKALAPVKAQQDRARQEIEAKLQAQMGPGWRTSSAGMEALARFDAQSSLAMAEVQQNALNSAASIYGTVAGGQLAGQSDITKMTANAFSNAAEIDKTVLAANQNVQSRLTNAELGAAGAAPINFAGPANAAGAMAGTPNAFTQIGAGAMQLGGQGIGSYLQGEQFKNTLTTLQNNAFANATGPLTTLPASNSFATGTV